MFGHWCRSPSCSWIFWCGPSGQPHSTIRFLFHAIPLCFGDQHNIYFIKSWGLFLVFFDFLKEPIGSSSSLKIWRNSLVTPPGPRHLFGGDSWLSFWFLNSDSLFSCSISPFSALEGYKSSNVYLFPLDGLVSWHIDFQSNPWWSFEFLRHLFWHPPFISDLVN